MEKSKYLKFKSYINSYVLALSERNTVSIRKNEAQLLNNEYFKKIYFIYLLLFDKKDSLMRLCKCDELKEYYEGLFTRYPDKEDFMRKLKANHPYTEEFNQLFISYRRYSNQRHTNLEQKLNIIENVNELRKTVKLSDYNIYKNLNINPGNFHAVFHLGIYRKMSLERCLAVYDYVLEQQDIMTNADDTEDNSDTPNDTDDNPNTEKERT